MGKARTFAVANNKEIKYPTLGKFVWLIRDINTEALPVVYVAKHAIIASSTTTFNVSNAACEFSKWGPSPFFSFAAFQFSEPASPSAVATCPKQTINMKNTSTAVSGVVPQLPAVRTHVQTHRTELSNALRRSARRAGGSCATDDPSVVPEISTPSASVSRRITRNTGANTYSMDLLNVSGGIEAIAEDTASKYDACAAETEGRGLVVWRVSAVGSAVVPAVSADASSSTTVVGKSPVSQTCPTAAPVSPPDPNHPRSPGRCIATPTRPPMCEIVENSEVNISKRRKNNNIT